MRTNQEVFLVYPKFLCFDFGFLRVSLGSAYFGRVSVVNSFDFKLPRNPGAHL